jgi:hypothetical protein
MNASAATSAGTERDRSAGLPWRRALNTRSHLRELHHSTRLNADYPFRYSLAVGDRVSVYLQLVNDGGSLAHAGGSEYTVVCRAASSARFVPEEGWEQHVHIPALGPSAVRARAFTRWAQEGLHQIPRELVIEVKGRSPT